MVINMGEIDSALDHLITAILNSQEYREYDTQRNRVKQYPELKEQIDEFRKRNYQLQTSDDNAFDKIDQLEKEYSELIENPLVSDFLDAELAFCRRMQDIDLRLTEAMHFE